jgi:hypothetical protein
MNVGYRKGAILRVGFRKKNAPEADARGETSRQIHDSFPMAIDADEVSPRFNIDLLRSEFGRTMGSGIFAEVVIEDLRHNQTVLPLPPIPDPSVSGEAET